MRKQRRVWLTGVVLVLFAVLNVLAYNHARAMTRFASDGSRTRKPEELSLAAKARVLLLGVNVPRPYSSRPPSDLAPDCRALAIAGADEVSLAAWYCDRGANTPLVILFHGYSAEKASLLQEAQTFLELGTSILLVDFRGSGGSSESYTTMGVREADDVNTAVQYADAHFSHSGLILFGQSMGAAAILRAVHERGVRPDAIILEAVFDTMLNTVRNRFSAMGVPSFPSAELLVFWGGRQWDYNAFAHRPVDYARSVECPALVLHRTGDPRAELDEARRVFDSLASKKSFVTFKAENHGGCLSVDPQKWKTAVDQIIAR